MKKAALIILCSLAFIYCERNEANKAPSCKIETPALGEEFNKGEDITISVEASDPDGEITEVRFFVDDLGIGSKNTFPYTIKWNTNDAETGNHIIKAIAKDDSGEDAEDAISISVNGPAPTVAFEANKQSIHEGESVRFTDKSQNNPNIWLWDFGDGSTSSDQNPEHTYNNEGIYDVKLTISSEWGTDVKTEADFITVLSSAPIADFYTNMTTITVGNQVAFYDQSSNKPKSWLWDFGDGGSSREQNPTHTYQSIGAFNVSLTVENEFGQDTKTLNNYIDVNEEPQGGGAIVIDGLANDAIWAFVDKYDIDRPFKEEQATLNSATWAAVWSDEGIYVLIEVEDDVWAPSWITGATDWESDKIELYFDMSNPQQDGFGADDGTGNWQVAPNFSETEPGIEIAFTGEIAAGVATAPGIKYATLYDTKGTYTFEYYVPFSTIPNESGEQIDPHVTNTIGFDVTVIDNDNDGIERQRKVWSNIGNIDESWANMDDVGSITFEYKTGDLGVVTGVPKELK